MLPILEAPLPSRFLSLVNDNKIPNDVDMIISQKSLMLNYTFQDKKN